MASIYNVHKYLQSKVNCQPVLFGFAFHSTPQVLEDYGPGMKFLGVGNEKEFEELEIYLKEELDKGSPVQSVWTEFPSNPLLVAADLGRLRKLADTYHFVLVVDDTIGSFCNIDVLGAADIVLTSLSKSFSGYADLLAACAILNPSSTSYPELKTLFQKHYRNCFYNGDAQALELNSRDYMARSATLNTNAARLVEFLQTQAADPKSSVSKVYYPTINPTLGNYQERMRKKTGDFTPGYGCLFSVELDTVEATIAFYDNLNVHNGPHLGAHLTLAMPYVKGLYYKKLDWAERYGLKETQIRVSVGLEDTETLLEVFKDALRAADMVNKRDYMVQT